VLDRPAASQQAGIESSLRRFLHQAVGPLDEAPDGLAFLSGSLLADRLEHLFEFLDLPFRFLEVILRRAGIGSTERAGVTNGCARVLQAGALVTIGCKWPRRPAGSGATPQDHRSWPSKINPGRALFRTPYWFMLQVSVLAVELCF
jgi:hypothetical protein